MTRWSLRLLGPFVAERDGVTLSGFRSDKVRALLAFLATQVDRPWSRATLADLLWPEQLDATARSNLRNALSNLRHVLDDTAADAPFVQVTPSAVQANGASPRWVDVDAFSSLAASAVEERGVEVDPAAVPQLEEALQLYRGPFLEGFEVAGEPFETWLESMRGRFHRQAVAVARTLAFAHARLGDAEAATVVTRRWLDLEPWDDAALRHLMRLLVLQDHRTEALAQYEAFRTRLDQDLGVGPEAETARQYAEIQAERASAGPVGGPGVVWPGLQRGQAASDAGPGFVAREDELHRLTGALERTLAGRGCIAFVAGEPGSGKTALLAEFARMALDADPRLVVVWGQGNAFTGRGDPFEPFRHVARMLSGEAEAPPAARASRADGAMRLWRTLPATLDALLEHGPDLIDRFVSGRSLLDFARRHVGVSADRLRRLEAWLERPRPATGPPGPGQQAALVEHFGDVVRALADQRPVVMILDDLQWIDAGSSDLLFHLARGVAGHRVLLAGAYRPEEAAARRGDETRSLADAFDELLAAEGSVRLDLTHAPGAPFVDALLDAEPNALGPTFREHLVDRTSGNALFTLELLDAMKQRGDVRPDGHGRLVEGPGLSWDEVPSRVEAVIERRIGRLSPACLELLTAAAVEGEAFTAEVAAAATGQPLSQACDRLSEEAGRRHTLVVAHTVRSVGDSSLALYRFRHGLFQTYLHQRLDAVQRAHLHGRVGRELRRLYRPDPERYREQSIALARHFEAAGLAAEAADAHADAAHQALGLWAFAEGVDHLRRALALLDTLPASAERDAKEFTLRLALGPPLTAIRGWSPPELAATYARVEELSAGVEDVAQLVEALWLLAVFHLGRSEHHLVQRALERLAALASKTGDPGLVALTRLNAGTIYQGRFTEARPQLEAAAEHPDLDVQRQLAHDFGMAPAVVALAYLAECVWFLGDPVEAERRQREARVWAERIDHPMTTCYMLGRAVSLAAVRGDADRTRALAHELATVAAAHDLGYFALAATLYAHRAAVRLGGTVADLDAMQTAIERCASTGTTLNQSTFLAHYAEACGELGQVERGLEAADAALAEADRCGERMFEAEAWRIKGSLLCLRAAKGGEPAQDLSAARASFESSIRTAREQGAVAIERRAIVALKALEAASGSGDAATTPPEGSGGAPPAP